MAPSRKAAKDAQDSRSTIGVEFLRRGRFEAFSKVSFQKSIKLAFSAMIEPSIHTSVGLSARLRDTGGHRERALIDKTVQPVLDSNPILKIFGTFSHFQSITIPHRPSLRLTQTVPRTYTAAIFLVNLRALAEHK